MFKKPIVLFLVGVVVMAGLFIFIPVNLFDGEVHFNNGTQQFTEPTNLALSYFFGIGIQPGDLKDVVGFNLTSKGYALATIFIFGIPGLLAYRVHLKSSKK